GTPPRNRTELFLPPIRRRVGSRDDVVRPAPRCGEPQHKGMAMRTLAGKGLMFLGVALLVGACGSSEQWAEWRAHTTHFASGQHATFSLRDNNDSYNTRV